jgi:hypothetical protein
MLGRRVDSGLDPPYDTQRAGARPRGANKAVKYEKNRPPWEGPLGSYMYVVGSWWGGGSRFFLVPTFNFSSQWPFRTPEGVP